MLLKDRSISSSAGTLASFTRPALIVPRLRERDTAGIIKELSQILHEHGAVPDVLAFYHAAINHEFLVNSSMECGLALPHARLNSLTEASFAFGRIEEPISWGSRPSQPISLVFLLAVPATDAAGFLQLLSALAKLGKQDGLLNELRSLDSPEGIFELFKRIKVHRG